MFYFQPMRILCLLIVRTLLFCPCVFLLLNEWLCRVVKIGNFKEIYKYIWNISKILLILLPRVKITKC